MDQQQSVIKKKPLSGSYVNFVNKLNRALKSQSEWNDKDEFLDVIYWLRQIIGVLIGCVWGILSFKGLLAILVFFLINALIVYLYSISYQKIDEDEFGGIWDILKEGFMTSFSTFLVSWIVVYSAFYNQ